MESCPLKRSVCPRASSSSIRQRRGEGMQNLSDQLTRPDYGFGGRFDGPAPPTIGGTPLWSRVCSRVGLKSLPNIGLTLYPEHPQLVGGAPLSRWSRTRARGLPQSFPAVAEELQPPITRHASKPTANRWIITPSMSFVVATHGRNGARTDAIKSTFSGGPPT